LNDAERLLLDHAPDGIFWTRRNGSLVYVNRAAAAMLGYSHEALLALRIFDIDTEMDARRWEQHWVATAPQESFTLERRHRRADGSEIPVKVFVRHLQHDGQAVHFSFVRDLTEQKRLETARRSRNQYLQALFADSPLPQFIVDPDSMTLVDANRAAHGYYGYPVLRGMALSRINTLPPEQIHEEMNRARTGKRNFFRFQHRLSSGDVRPVHVYTGPIEHEGRQLLHSTIEDVSAIHEAQKRLEGYRDLVERLPIGVYRATLGGDGVFLAINPVMRKIFDAETDCELIGHRAAEFYAHPEQRAEFSEQVQATGEVRRVIVEARTCKGRPIWIALSSRVTTLDDGSSIIEGAVEDVTGLHRTQQELEQAYAQFAHAIAAAPIPIILFRADGRIEAVNQVWLELTGYSREELPNLTEWTRLAYGERQAAVLDIIARLRQIPGPIEEGDFEIRCKDGSTRIWSFNSAPLEPEDNPNRLLISTAIDVTSARASEARMRQAEAVIDSANEGITITGPDRNIERVNRAFSRITGYSESEVVGKNPRILSSGRQDAEFYRRMWDSIDRRGHWQGEIWNRRKSGAIYPEWLSISAVHDAEGQLVNYAAVFTDLTELKESETRLDFLQRKDALTGLDNRARLLQEIDLAIESSQQTGDQVIVVLCGLDRFQRINASLGYPVGDRVLKRIGQRFSRIAGEHRIARVGGDQFAMLLRSTDPDRRTRRALRAIRNSVARDIKLTQLPPIPISISIGIARFPSDGDSAETLLSNAESAMFRAKQQRRGGTTFFSAEENQNAHRILLLESDLRRAIDNRELAVFYQPIVRLCDRQIVGAEALARWHSTEHGQVPPDEFIPLAEESGLIRPLTQILLERAAFEAVQMRQRFGPEFRLAFNFSASQLDDASFARQIFARLAAAGLPHESFEMELTESTMMSQDPHAAEMLGKLREGGIRLSIDDFGTGFSSLAYLHELNANSLKIDWRFIAQLGCDPAGERITESIIAMAHALGMAVIAEGVETTDQRDRIDALGCEYAQGYLFSPPRPFDEFMGLYGLGVG
jgi:diguanylate cyclase (GGDEF)-like protein/PAS domain S-box-containing protein